MTLNFKKGGTVERNRQSARLSRPNQDGMFNVLAGHKIFADRKKNAAINQSRILTSLHQRKRFKKKSANLIFPGKTKPELKRRNRTHPVPDESIGFGKCSSAFKPGQASRHSRSLSQPDALTHLTSVTKGTPTINRPLAGV